jgi:hypothetical protein
VHQVGTLVELDRPRLRSIRAAGVLVHNEVILLIFYKCIFSKERSVLPEDGRITETRSS